MPHVTKTELPVQIVGPDGRVAFGTVQLLEFSGVMRFRRAAQLLAGCWVLSLGSMFVPLAHSILVPGFFLGGIVGAYVLWITERIVRGGQGSCPRCHLRLAISRSPDRWPLDELCRGCDSRLFVELGGGAAEWREKTDQKLMAS